MNRIAAFGGSDHFSSNVGIAATAEESRICSSEQAAVCYTMWPTSVAAAQVIYALAFMAARNRVIELQRVQLGHTRTNLANSN